MQYRGLEYSVVQGIKRGSWKWSVRLRDGGVKKGSEGSRPAALKEAERAIDVALAPRKRRAWQDAKADDRLGLKAKK